MKINRIRASMITTLSFFVENIYNCYIALLEQKYTNLLSPVGVHLQISSFLRLLVLCLVRPDLFVIHNSLFIFSKELISFIGSLDECHTSVFFFLSFDYNEGWTVFLTQIYNQSLYSPTILKYVLCLFLQDLCKYLKVK